MSVNTFFVVVVANLGVVFAAQKRYSQRLLRAKELSLVQGEVREIERTRKMGQIWGERRPEVMAK